MTKRVLALLHVSDDPMGNVGEVLEEHAIPCDVVNATTEVIPDPTTYDALIIFGGVEHVYEGDQRYPYFTQEKALLRKAVEHEVPTLGICLGGQLLAHVLGAEVKRHTFTEIGFFDVPLTAEGRSDPLYQGLPGYQKVFHWHEDIFDLPQGAIRLAESTSTQNQAFRYGRHMYGLQYHIELNPEMLNNWLHHPSITPELINTLGTERYHALEQEAMKHYPVYREHTRIMFENFLRISKLL